MFDSPTVEPVISRRFKATWLSWGSHVLVLYDGEHPKKKQGTECIDQNLL